MSKVPILISVNESEPELRGRLRSGRAAMRPRINMLLTIAGGTPCSGTLALSPKANTSGQSIRTRKEAIPDRGHGSPTARRTRAAPKGL